MCLCFLFFFFKQKTAYEMLRSLVGSEMCIRDRLDTDADLEASELVVAVLGCGPVVCRVRVEGGQCGGVCLLYTSDAADDLLCVDLGGRRIIKKKKTINEQTHDNLYTSTELTKHTTHVHPTITHL